MSLFTELTLNEQATLSGGTYRPKRNKRVKINIGGAGGAGGAGGDAVLIVKGKGTVIVKDDLNIVGGDGGDGGDGGAAG